MKNPLNKTELTGLLLLVILVVGITGSAVLMRSCRQPNEAVPVENTVPEGVDATVEIIVPGEEKAPSEGKKKKKEPRKKREKKAQKKKNTRDVQAPHEPFSDTIPTEF